MGRRSWLGSVLAAGMPLIVVQHIAGCRSKLCVPGEQVACACPDGSGKTGVQICDGDGQRFLHCECRASSAAGAAGGPARPSDANDGSDPRRPVLAPEDAGFVDRRGGWDWSDRCWINLKKGKYGWAKAECEMGMKIGPDSPTPRSSLLYNLGLIERTAGDVEGARRYFEQSLALREHPEVRTALDSLPGSASARPRAKKQIACGEATCDAVCCATFGKFYCGRDPNTCDRATNGEGTLYECDGREDCGIDEVCCLEPMDRTTAATCLPRSKCTGVFHHPRYEQDIPLRVVCHTTADCPAGMNCSPEKDFDKLATCR